MTSVDARAETYEIPKKVRDEVRERDGRLCRVCGSYADGLALHHIRYRSEGGLHVASNLVSVHWMFEPRCHELVHSNKRLWQPILLAIAEQPGITALQWKRWHGA